MATEIIVRKMYDSFAPVDQSNLELMESFKLGGEYKATFTQPRNLPFHRKFFALLDIAFDAWEPEPVMYRGMEIAKNKERFREDITILAGYGEPTFNLNSEVRYKAKSISFAKMDQKTFDKLYSAAINVVLQRVLTNYTRHDLGHVVDEVLGFA